MPVFDQGDTTLRDAAGCGTKRLAGLSVTFTSDDPPLGEPHVTAARWMVRPNRLKAAECVGAKGRFGGPRAKLVPNLGTVTPKRHG